MVYRLQSRPLLFCIVAVAFILSITLLGLPGTSYASFSDARELYDWGDDVGPRVLADEDVQLKVGATVSGYVVEL